MSVLLDANVLIAVTVTDHPHHDTAMQWLQTVDTSVATCPSTQGSLLRFVLRETRSRELAFALLDAVISDPRHEFWADDVPYTYATLRGVLGHRQVTDAYLAHLARTRKARLATFDVGLAQQHGDVVELLSAS